MIDALLVLAARQQGYFLRRQADEAGVSDAALRVWMRAGHLVRIRHGVYAPRAAWQAATDAERLAVSTRAVMHRLGSGFLASHTSAAALHGLELFDVDPRLVHVTALTGHRGRTERHLVQHVAPPAEAERTSADGVACVSTARAVVESASLMTLEGTMVTASSALHLGRTSDEELSRTARAMRNRKGMRRAVLGLSLADAGCHSAGEARSLFMCWEQGLPRPECQVEVHDVDGLAGIVDMGWMAWRHLGEFDGLVKYGRQNPWSSDPIATLVDEKRREDRIRDGGWGMSRWTWRDLDPAARPRTAARIREALERSRRWYSTPA